MNNTVLQVPISKTLRAQALQSISQMGFSSLQEYIRVFLNQTVNRNISISFGPKVTKLSPKAIKRYNKMIDDIESGKEKVFTAHSVSELLNHLHGNKNPVQP